MDLEAHEHALTVPSAGRVELALLGVGPIALQSTRGERLLELSA